MTNRFDVIIIGAGPGGLACATKLAQSGRTVLLLEKKKTPGPKVCAGGITWAGRTDSVPEHLIERSFPTQIIETGAQRFALHAETPMVSTVRREALGAWMAARAVEAGVDLRCGCRLVSISPDAVIARDADGTTQKFFFSMLVGADGSHSRVRRFLNIPFTLQGLGIHYLVPGHFGEMEWHLKPRLFGNGYAWIFPFNDHASIGAYRMPAAGQEKEIGKQLHHSLKNWCHAKKILLNGLTPRSGHILCGYKGLRFNKNFFLVGDAAGLASGLTGEGIVPAMVSGHAVAVEIAGGEKAEKAIQPLLKKQHLHHLILRLTTLHPFINLLVMETLAMGLRTKMVPFDALEMGSSGRKNS